MSAEDLVPLAHERAVLGCVLAGQATVGDTGPLAADDFGHGPHRHVWHAFRALDAVGHPIDHLTVAECLKEQGRLAEIGGPAFLMGLDQGIPLAHNLPSYCHVVTDYAARRHIIAEAMRAVEGAKDLKKRPATVAAEASGSLLLTETHGGDESGDVDLHEITDRWDRYAQMTEEERVKHSPYLPMPWGWMREAGVLGFPESLSVIAGRSGIGKTATLSTCAAYWLKLLPHKGGIIGLEDGTVWLDERWIAKSLGIDYGLVGAMRLNEWQEQRYAEHYGTYGPLLRDKLRKYRRAGMTSSKLISQCRRWIDQGLKWIIVDHGLRVIYENDGRLRDDKVIGRTVETLADLALNTKTHIIMAWHLNRAQDDETQPSLGDLKESGYLDAAARFIWAPWRKQGRTMATVVKATKVAPVGLTCQLEWAGRSGMFDTELGRVVDFEAERRAAQEAAKEARASGKRKVLFGGAQ